jgi:hypothetical protein
VEPREIVHVEAIRTAGTNVYASVRDLLNLLKDELAHPGKYDQEGIKMLLKDLSSKDIDQRIIETPF